MKWSKKFRPLFALAALTAVSCDPLQSDEEIPPPPPVIVDDSGDQDSGGDDGGSDPDPTLSCPGGFRFAISESPVDASIQHGDLRNGIYPLFLWKLRNTGISALEGVFVIEGGTYFEGSFSAEDPFIAINIANGPDVMTAVGGCPCDSMLIGQFYVDAGPEGVRVRLTPGPTGGAVNCATNPAIAEFLCSEYSSRAEAQEQLPSLEE
jgi:hypothetical protein